MQTHLHKNIIMTLYTQKNNFLAKDNIKLCKDLLACQRFPSLSENSGKGLPHLYLKGAHFSPEMVFQMSALVSHGKTSSREIDPDI